MQTDLAGLRKLNIKPAVEKAKGQPDLSCKISQEIQNLAASVSLSEVSLGLNHTCTSKST